MVFRVDESIRTSYNIKSDIDFHRLALSLLVHVCQRKVVVLCCEYLRVFKPGDEQ